MLAFYFSCFPPPESWHIEVALIELLKCRKFPWRRSQQTIANRQKLTCGLFVWSVSYKWYLHFKSIVKRIKIGKMCGRNRIWPTKPKIFIIWHFMEKVCRSCFRGLQINKLAKTWVSEWSCGAELFICPAGMYCNVRAK